MFEYDEAKSRANRVKHGIDFETAQALWSDPLLLVVPARTEIESRFLAVGLIRGVHWSCVWTRRGSAIRLISARRSRKEEIERYESA